jgi:hypothetical protein
MLLGALGGARRHQIPQLLLTLFQCKFKICISKNQYGMLLGEFGRPRRHQIPQQILQLLNSFKFLLLKMYAKFKYSLL